MTKKVCDMTDQELAREVDGLAYIRRVVDLTNPHNRAIPTDTLERYGKLLALEEEMSRRGFEVEASRSPADAVHVLYTNHKGESRWRLIQPKGIRFAATEWHPSVQWLLDAIDLDSGEHRTFAIKDIRGWEV